MADQPSIRFEDAKDKQCMIHGKQRAYLVFSVSQSDQCLKDREFGPFCVECIGNFLQGAFGNNIIPVPEPGKTFDEDLIAYQEHGA